MADLNTEKILATDFCDGREHDFQLFKHSRCAIAPETCLLADSGYQGVLAFHPNSQTPVKKSKLHPLSQEQKASNRELSRKRILIENIIRRLKIFRILSVIFPRFSGGEVKPQPWLVRSQGDFDNPAPSDGASHYRTLRYTKRCSVGPPPAWHRSCARSIRF
jgi:hypothetical protein